MRGLVMYEQGAGRGEIVGLRDDACRISERGVHLIV